MAIAVSTKQDVLNPHAVITRQGKRNVYSISLSVRDIVKLKLYDVNRLDLDTNSGYQRNLLEANISNLKKFILKSHARKDLLMPTSVTLVTDKKIPISTNGTLRIDKSMLPFNVLDGQHRLEGWKRAAADCPELLDYEISVTIIDQMSSLEQLVQFMIINTTQRKAENDLVQAHRATLSEYAIEDLPTLPDHIETIVGSKLDKAAIEYIKYMKETRGSPWYKQVGMANGQKRKLLRGHKVLPQSSIVSAFRKFFFKREDNPILKKPTKKQHEIFLNYWKALANIIGSVDNAPMLYINNGIKTFVGFAPHFLRAVDERNYAFDPSTLEGLLRPILSKAGGDATGISYADYWKIGTKIATINHSGIVEIIARLKESLNTEVKQWKQGRK